MKMFKMVLFATGFGCLWTALVLGEEPGRFRFPGGSETRGKATFEKMDCIRCHTIEGANLRELDGKRWLNLPLAGETRFVKNYEDIITAIANPQHVVDQQYQKMIKDVEFRDGINAYMPDFTSEMSVLQLMDLTAFLDKVYREKNETYGKK